MNGEIYIPIIMCTLITTLIVISVIGIIWFAEYVYHDMSEKRRWRKRR